MTKTDLALVLSSEDQLRIARMQDHLSTLTEKERGKFGVWIRRADVAT
ncbi:hypothetical protein [Variovorax sp. OK605]|nr:hypothetical protein [Variovorax sp. OK605]